ncbi:MAG: ABC transporter ATP-binding protein [Campylobacterales bacterium]
MQDKTPVIEIKKLVKNYKTDAGELEVLKNLDITIEEGEFVALMGPSGSGKSTFMNILGCLDKPTSGKYVLNGTDVSLMDKDGLSRLRNNVIGFVFQGFNLLPRINLIDNVALPLVYAGVDKAQRSEKALQLLKSVGLEKYATHLPSQISGGQQQRVAIARALINSPKLLLADEPTGNLDTKTSIEIMDIFSALNKQNGITIVLVTHEHDIAEFATRQIHFRDGIVELDDRREGGNG